jgi:transmembrane sensor
MSDLAERVRAIGEQVDAGYDAERTEAALVSLGARLRRRRAKRIALGSTVGMLCLVGGAFLAARVHRDGRTQASAARAEALLTLTDGSVVMPLDPASRVLARTVSPRRVELELVSGSARFEVAPNREREFRVQAGQVAITVVGTKFQVDRQGERTAVAVQAGRVRVAWERGEQLLDPGERGVFPPFEPASPAGTSREAESPLQETPLEPRASLARKAPDWRALAEKGDFAGAYRLLHGKGKLASLTGLDDLLLAADVARTSGHPRDAVPYLQRVLVLHAGDARSAVAAFTLGRVSLADLDDPAGAADAFAKARAAAPGGPLAEDALAREIEARFRSGDAERAHKLAEEYVRTWPSGSRAREVRHFGGLP